MHSFLKSRHHIILIIYDAMFFFFLFKMFFYMIFVGRFPDEIAHVSYIAYLQEQHVVIPEFKDMTILQMTGPVSDPSSVSAKMGFGGTFRFSSRFNYLGHPPLYYQIMRLAGGVTVNNGKVSVDILRLRSFSILLAALAMLLMFYIGFTRLGNVPSIHLLYAAVCVSVPMLAYDCAGVNNDTLALLGIAVFLLGLLRFSENKRGAATYAIIGVGVTVSLLAKLVAGLVIVIASAFFLVFTIKKEKGIRFLFSRSVLALFPACAVAVVYFLIVHKQTGSFQPTYLEINPQQFHASSFYVPLAHRQHYNLSQYARYYWNAFLRTWTGIYSYVALQKSGSFFSLKQIGLVSLWALPLPLFLQVRKKFHYPMIMTLLSIYTGLILTAGIQFFRAYHEFKSVSGYLGGYQSRYYLCLIPLLALAAVCAVGFFYDSDFSLLRSDSKGNPLILNSRQLKFRRRAVVVFCCAFTALLLYEDFIYFVIHFRNYL